MKTAQRPDAQTWADTLSHKLVHCHEIVISRIECFGITIFVTEPPLASSLPLHLQLYDLFDLKTLVVLGFPGCAMTPVANRGIEVTYLPYLSPTDLPASVLGNWYALMEKHLLNPGGAKYKSSICVQDDTMGVKSIILLSLFMYSWGMKLESVLRWCRRYFPRTVFTSDEESFFYKQISVSKKAPRVKLALFRLRHAGKWAQLRPRCG